ncbi:YodC family protein [Bradyrhizobium arachidis]|uniref:YodC family protein n=1 Tax=Bradyrhizobium TaxID=374 RepID=UPI0021612B8C|nr:MULTISPECIES: YodC family protein [Bradyrhizobium]MDN4988041.1 YodC family protein [Bradyrhizobium sp. WYCCWR 13022]UVO35303.1 YodC family protein [Bradyrhizobium arachidis]
MELKAGDIVMLKSGGQPLTVAEVKGEDVLCVWMGMEGDLFRETLPLATLIHVEEDEDDEDEEEDDEDDE